MNSLLLPRLAAAVLSALVVLSGAVGLDGLATHEHAATALAQGRTTPALLAVAASSSAHARIATTAGAAQLSCAAPVAIRL
jgi:hypothetical protein